MITIPPGQKANGNWNQARTHLGFPYFSNCYITYLYNSPQNAILITSAFYSYVFTAAPAYKVIRQVQLLDGFPTRRNAICVPQRHSMTPASQHLPPSLPPYSPSGSRIHKIQHSRSHKLLKSTKFTNSSSIYLSPHDHPNTATKHRNSEHTAYAMDDTWIKLWGCFRSQHLNPPIGSMMVPDIAGSTKSYPPRMTYDAEHATAWQMR